MSMNQIVLMKENFQSQMVSQADSQMNILNYFLGGFMSSVFYLVLVFAVIYLLKKTIVIVPQQKSYVVERLGKYSESLQAGFHTIVPFVDRIAYRMLLKEVPMDVEPQVCITKDNAQVQIDGIIYFQVTDAKLAAYGTSDFVSAIEQLAKTTLRSECGKRELDKLLEERQEINRAVIAALDEASPNWGVKVLRYEVKDITPPEGVLKAMQMQLTAEREKRAKIAQSEGKKIEEINLADGERQASIAKSEGERQAAINRAQGDAEAILLVAEASAKAIEKVASAIKSDGGEDAVALKVAEKYIDAFSNLAKENNTMIIPANMSEPSSLIASAMKIIDGVKSK